MLNPLPAKLFFSAKLIASVQRALTSFERFLDPTIFLPSKKFFLNSGAPSRRPLEVRLPVYPKRVANKFPA